jgi:uncharacterized protein CbrC (UPF0167 family)
MNEILPFSRFHPDFIGTGSVEKSDNTCICCQQARGFIYTGAVFDEEDLHDKLCPWCIIDGAAHEKFEALFCDASDFYESLDNPQIPENEIIELTQRTPIFAGWQQPHWLIHCGHACMFLGACSNEMIRRHRKTLEPQIRKESGYNKEAEFQKFYASIDIDTSVLAWFFRCSVCGELLTYLDYT